MDKPSSQKTAALLSRGQTILTYKVSLNSFWQTVAYNFYPQRAFFTYTYQYQNQAFGAFPFNNQFANNLTTSYPILIARDLASSISTYLRPSGQQWFKAQIKNKEIQKNISNESLKYLQFITDTISYYLEDEATGFPRAAKESDADLTVFGQSCLSGEIDWDKNNVVFRTWFLRDVGWEEDAAGNVSFVVREWNTTIRNAYERFNMKLSAQVRAKLEKEGNEPFKIIHIVLKTKDYENFYSKDEADKGKIKLPWVSLYIEADSGHEIECVGSPTEIYRINRWETLGGSQYAVSPAVVAGLPDARLLQAMTLSLLEAAEKSVSPPIIAKQDAIRGDIGLLANTVSWVKEDLPGSVDDNVKQMQIDKSGLQFGLTMQNDSRAMLRSAFYIDKINLPVFDSKMTATEVRERVAEYIRNAAPLFSTMIANYNQPLLKMVFTLLKSIQAFGPNNFIPDELRDPITGGLRDDIDFSFSSPLLEAEGMIKAQKFAEMRAMIAESVALDAATMYIPDASIALRDSLEGIGVPAKWLRDEDVVASMVEAEKQQQSQQQYIQTLAAGGQAAEQIGKGAQAVQQAGIL